MARPRNPQPKIHTHQGSERVSVGGKWVVLGPIGSESSKAEYARILALLAVDPLARIDKPAGYTVVELIRDYKHSDEPTQSVMGLLNRMGSLVAELHLSTRVSDFGPVALAAWQKWLCDKRDRQGERLYAKTYVNLLVSALRQVFRWGVATERIPYERLEALRTVRGPKAGQARPGRKVKPVADAVVIATLPHLPRSVAGIVRVQRLTGGRPGEIVGLRPCDLDRSGAVWTFTPSRHKTAGKDRTRVLYFGPLARAVLAEFSPAEASAPYFPIAVGKGNTDPAAAYSPRTYRTAIQRGCRRAKVEVWFPYQLRHARLTEVRETLGIEAAQSVGGHAKLSTTEVYAGRVEALARRAAAETG